MIANNLTRRLLLPFLLLTSLIGHVDGQHFPHDPGDICCRVDGPQENRPNPSQGANPSNGASFCTYVNIEEFAELSLNELIDYLIVERSPLTCVYPALFSFNSIYSLQVFSDANVKYVADTAIPLASNYDGSNDNGIYSMMTFLNIAAQMALYYSNDISYSQSTWNAIRSSCSILAVNPNLRNDSNLSLRISAELWGTASSNKVSDDPNVISFAGYMLQNINNATYNSDADTYLYYYSYYYLLDVYFRYATNNPAYITNLAAQSSVLGDLSELTINTDINSDTYIYFGQLSSLSIDALGRHGIYPVLADDVSDALLEVTYTYPPYSSNWVNASLELVDRDFPYELGREEIIENIVREVLPYTYQFDDGKFQVTTSLPYAEVLSLYEAAQQIKAQFFRLLQGDHPVINDPNDTLRIKVYGTREEYQSYNDMLFEVNYPNSGGVYIETQGTFYTYQRTEEESPYSLEALFRHEYAHYLQGRYLIPNEWGQSPYYDNSRLVWFEEGMAQFLAGSTIHDGVKGLEVFRNQIQNNTSIPSLDIIFDSSYASGNPDAYYVYGPMVWLRWYQTNQELIYLLFQYISSGDLTAFDQIIDSYRNNATETNLFKSYVQHSVNNDALWNNPRTVGLTQSTIQHNGLAAIENEIASVDPNIEITSSEVEYVEDPKRYRVTGTIAIPNYDSNTSAILTLQAKMDQILSNLSATYDSNIYDHSVGYFEDIVHGSTLTATFHILGPYEEIIMIDCADLGELSFSVEVYEDYAVLIPDPDFVDRHQFRYRAVTSNAWINLLQSSEESDVIRFLTNPVGYEYAMRYECDGEWTEYSASKTFTLCPEEKTVGQVQLDINNVFKADRVVTTQSKIMPLTEIGFQAGESVELLPEFEVKLGGLLEVKMKSCRDQ